MIGLRIEMSVILNALNKNLLIIIIIIIITKPTFLSTKIYRNNLNTTPKLAKLNYYSNQSEKGNYGYIKKKKNIIKCS